MQFAPTINDVKKTDVTKSKLRLPVVDMSRRMPDAKSILRTQCPSVVPMTPLRHDEGGSGLSHDCWLV